jgi:gamma-glutamyltranspeptidase / glutathione hydrolase
VLREGGNAVDAAICAVLTSFVTESQLTGFGAGGFMMVHEAGEDTLIDFFVAAGGADGVKRKAELIPIPVYFDETPQTFNCGVASCGVPGTAAGLEHVWPSRESSSGAWVCGSRRRPSTSTRSSTRS